MKTLTALLIFFYIFLAKTYANDGAFFAKGNQLIPIKETSITVKKEILTLKKISNKYIQVTVYYEFFNPKSDKEILVGFEAFSPNGDVDGTPKNGKHPYMNNFTVNINNHKINYEVAIVKDSLYYQKNAFKSYKSTEIIKTIHNVNEVEFYYVYHFKAKFKKGLNIIKHTYNFDLSGSVDLEYNFEYVLTAANRWGNKQIDDFTLIIDNGDFEDFNISKTFFTDSKDWKINGIGKTTDVKGNPSYLITEDALKFIIQKGNIVFTKKNFHPKGELFVYALNQIYAVSDLFNYKESTLPLEFKSEIDIYVPTDEISKKILKNYPFARRGYIFQNKDIQNYYLNMTDWYIPNPDYKPEIKELTKEEKLWLKKWK